MSRSQYFTYIAKVPPEGSGILPGRSAPRGKLKQSNH